MTIWAKSIRRQNQRKEKQHTNKLKKGGKVLKASHKI